MTAAPANPVAALIQKTGFHPPVKTITSGAQR